MNDTLILLLAWTAGGALGALFFGGLFWTVRRGVSSRHPALLFLGSLLLRATITLAGFYVVSAGHLDRLVVCLLGFFVARLLVTRLTGAPVERGSGKVQEVGHAPHP